MKKLEDLLENDPVMMKIPTENIFKVFFTVQTPLSFGIPDEELNSIINNKNEEVSEPKESGDGEDRRVVVLRILLNQLKTRTDRIPKYFEVLTTIFLSLDSRSQRSRIEPDIIDFFHSWFELSNKKILAFTGEQGGTDHFFHFFTSCCRTILTYIFENQFSEDDEVVTKIIEMTYLMIQNIQTSKVKGCFLSALMNLLNASLHLPHENVEVGEKEPSKPVNVIVRMLSKRYPDSILRILRLQKLNENSNNLDGQETMGDAKTFVIHDIDKLDVFVLDLVNILLYENVEMFESHFDEIFTHVRIKRYDDGVIFPKKVKFGQPLVFWENFQNFVHSLVEYYHGVHSESEKNHIMDLESICKNENFVKSFWRIEAFSVYSESIADAFENHGVWNVRKKFDEAIGEEIRKKHKEEEDAPDLFSLGGLSTESQNNNNKNNKNDEDDEFGFLENFDEGFRMKKPKVEERPKILGRRYGSNRKRRGRDNRVRKKIQINRVSRVPRRNNSKLNNGGSSDVFVNERPWGDFSANTMKPETQDMKNDSSRSNVVPKNNETEQDGGERLPPRPREPAQVETGGGYRYKGQRDDREWIDNLPTKGGTSWDNFSDDWDKKQKK